jgi:hypothetical protein
MANCNLVGRWAREDEFYELERRGLICWGGLSAGCWQYIGSQGVIQGTFEIFACIATQLGLPDLRGKFILTAGLGGMGGPGSPYSPYGGGRPALPMHGADGGQQRGVVRRRGDDDDDGAVDLSAVEGPEARLAHHDDALHRRNLARPKLQSEQRPPPPPPTPPYRPKRTRW